MYHKYVTMKSPNYININSEDFLYCTVNDLDECFIEENDEIKYLVFDSTDENKEVLKKYAKHWKETKKQIEALNDGKPIEYRKNFMRIRFE